MTLAALQGDGFGKTTPAVKAFPADWTDRELLVELLRQQRGYNLDGWPQLGGRTQVDALAVIGAKLGLDGFTAPDADQ